MVIPRHREMAFAIITGIEFMAMPYVIQSEMPATKKRYIPKDISLADLDLYILITCGSSDRVVSPPARYPSTETWSITALSPKLNCTAIVKHNYAKHLNYAGQYLPAVPYQVKYHP
jgi:hypothetical protein